MARSLSIFLAALLIPVLTLPSAARWKPKYAQLDPKIQQFIRNLHGKRIDQLTKGIALILIAAVVIGFLVSAILALVGLS